MQTEEDYPEKNYEWAVNTRDQAVLLLEENENVPQNNIERSIVLLQSTMSVWSEKRCAEDWAGTKMSLGNAFIKRKAGLRARNLEYAIAALECTLKVWSLSYNPKEWANVQQILGDVYLLRIAGNRAENIEISHECYSRALKVWSDLRNPTRWASTKLSIAKTAILGADCKTDEAFKCCEDVFRCMDKKGYPKIWSEAQVVLSEAMLLSTPPDYTGAINSLRSALKSMSRNDDQRKARTMLLLANALSSRGEQEDMREAIKCYRKCARSFSLQKSQQDWINTHLNLARSIQITEQFNNVNYTDTAIALCKRALSVINSEENPLEWAKAKLLLAELHMQRVSRSEQKDNGYLSTIPLSVLFSLGNKKLDTEHNLLKIEESINEAIPAIDVDARPVLYLKQCIVRAEAMLRLKKYKEAEYSIAESFETLTYVRCMHAAGLLRHNDLIRDCQKIFDLKVSLLLKNKMHEKALNALNDCQYEIVQCEIADKMEIHEFFEEANLKEFKIYQIEWRAAKIQLEWSKGDIKHQYKAARDLLIQAEQGVDEWLGEASRKRDFSIDAEGIIRKADMFKLFNYLDEKKAMAILIFQTHTFDSPASLNLFVIWEKRVLVRSIGEIGGNGEPCRKSLDLLLQKLFQEIVGWNMPQKLIVVPGNDFFDVSFAELKIGHDSDSLYDQSLEHTAQKLDDIISGGVYTVPSLSNCLVSSKNNVNSISKVISATSNRIILKLQIGTAVCAAADRRPELRRVRITNLHNTITGSSDLQDCHILQIAFPSTCVQVSNESVHLRFGAEDAQLLSDSSSEDIHEYNALKLTDIWRLKLKSCKLAVTIAVDKGNELSIRREKKWFDLASAFLIAGAQYVLYTRWPVDELTAFLVLSRFYRNLRKNNQLQRGNSIENCLREAQKWFCELTTEERIQNAHKEGIYETDATEITKHDKNWTAFNIIGPPQ